MTNWFENLVVRFCKLEMLILKRSDITLNKTKCIKVKMSTLMQLIK